MTTFTAAGAKLSISSAAPATHNSAGFAALTYTEIKEIVDLGEGYSREYNPVDYSPISTREIQTRKGSYTSGAASVKYAIDYDDAGQDLLRTAAASDALYSFKLELQTGDIIYFQALVMGSPLALGDVDTIAMTTAELRIQNGGTVLVEAP